MTGPSIHSNPASASTREPPPAEQFYICDPGAGAIFATFHDAAEPAHDVTILLCPPFGWEDMCSYRSRREWAQSLARLGFAVLRIDLPGSGDSSGGPDDPERLRAWTAGVAAAARWLSKATGARRVVAIGIGLGGAIAHNALAAGAPIDDLVLWGAYARGRTHLRELRAFSSMESPGAAAQPAAASSAQDPGGGSLAVAGYVLSPETQSELQELDLAERDCPRLRAAHVLMLERDGRAVDARLKSSIERAGAKLTVGSGDGYAAMMMVELPHAVSADSVLEQVTTWLLSDVVGSERAREAAPAMRDSRTSVSSAEISTPDGTQVRETAIRIPHPLGDPVGVLTEPLNGALEMCAVWLNAGPQRRIGPNRMWVETARRWAALGVSSLRVDLNAIGDADGDPRQLLDVRSYFTNGYLEQVRLMLDTLEARGLGPRFILGGLCAGAYWSLRMAQDDGRVSAAVALNPAYVVYDGGLSSAIRQSRAVASRMLLGSTWRRALKGELTPAAHLLWMRTILAALARSSPRLPSRLFGRGVSDHDNAVAEVFDRLQEHDQRALILFAGEERLYGEMLASGSLSGLERWPNVSVQHIPFAGNMHTLRPTSLQQETHRLMDELLERELERLAR
ncbi:MAG: alpha/beta fold hydrolase [Solirubrobacteraceae bacterium]